MCVYMSVHPWGCAFRSRCMFVRAHVRAYMGVCVHAHARTWVCMNVREFVCAQVHILSLIRREFCSITPGPGDDLISAGLLVQHAELWKWQSLSKPERQISSFSGFAMNWWFPGWLMAQRGSICIQQCQSGCGISG